MFTAQQCGHSQMSKKGKLDDILPSALRPQAIFPCSDHAFPPSQFLRISHFVLFYYIFDREAHVKIKIQSSVNQSAHFTARNV